MTKRHPYGICAVVIVSGILMWTGGVGANEKSRPFRAEIQGNANPVPTADPCVLTNTETATGQATHLGAMTLQTSEVVNFCTNPQGADIHGEFTMTAANGDQVFGRYTTLAQLNFQTNQITFGGAWEIVGGTGRFENAGGDGVLVGSGDLLPPFGVTASFSGGIIY